MNDLSQSHSEDNGRVSRTTKLVATSLLVIGTLLAIMGLVALILLRDYSFQFLLLLLVFLFSLVMFICTALLLKINPNFTITLIGLALAMLSFAYQPSGPTIRKVGTECIPLEDCYRPVRGGGFPIQYVIDFPGITFPDVLGSEDDFRFWAFVLDFVFYMGLVQLVYRLTRYLHARKKMFKAMAG